MKFINHRFIRFLLVGACNTLLSYGVYLLLLECTAYPLAYTGSYAIGIVTAYLMNTWFVFSSSVSWKKISRYPLVYLAQYGVGLILLFLEIHFLKMNAQLAPLLNVTLLMPLTFMLNKWCIVGKQADDKTLHP